jgi:outer membrane protease
LKKLRLFLVFLVFLGFSANAESINNGHNFSFGISYGLLSGQCDEIIYRERSDSYLSRLTWFFEPVAALGLDLHYSWQNQSNHSNIFTNALSGVFADASIKYGLNYKPGLMEDRDWVMLLYSDWLTHYSLHESKTDTAILGDFSAGKMFRLNDAFSIKAFLSYSFIYYAFSAYGGAFLYPEVDGGHVYMANQAKVATYQQTWHVLSPGISFQGVFNKFFDIELFLKASPLVWVSTYDEHLNRNLDIIMDSLFLGLFVEPGLLFSFNANSNLTFSFSLNYRNISYLRGDVVYEELNEAPVTYYNSGGTGYSVLDIGIGMKFKIF